MSTNDLTIEVYNKTKSKFLHNYFVTMSGGTGPTAEHVKIIIGMRVDRDISLEDFRKEIIIIQNQLIETVNENEYLLKEFQEDCIDRKNISVALIQSYNKKNDDWEVDSVGAHRNSISYSTSAMLKDRHWFYVDDQKVTHHVIEKIDAPKEYYFDLGKETYEESERIAFGEAPFEKVITFTQWGNYSVPLELHGPWGFFIERTVAEQIRSGNYIYYAEVNGEKHKLAAKEHQVIVEATGQPIVEVWTPLKEKDT